MSDDRKRHPPWYRIPVVWVAAGALLASVIGCFVNVAVAWQYTETSLSEVAPGKSFLLPSAGEDDNRP